ncbi:hypothetical protein C0J52_19361 [Blattella germanica]|nr:hypothetical protein C0J52_19361 [Blattella germanica]
MAKPTLLHLTRLRVDMLENKMEHLSPLAQEIDLLKKQLGITMLQQNVLEEKPITSESKENTIDLQDDLSAENIKQNLHLELKKSLSENKYLESKLNELENGLENSQSELDKKLQMEKDLMEKLIEDQKLLILFDVDLNRKRDYCHSLERKLKRETRLREFYENQFKIEKEKRKENQRTENFDKKHNQGNKCQESGTCTTVEIEKKLKGEKEMRIKCEKELKEVQKQLYDCEKKLRKERKGHSEIERKFKEEHSMVNKYEKMLKDEHKISMSLQKKLIQEENFHINFEKELKREQKSHVDTKKKLESVESYSQSLKKKFNELQGACTGLEEHIKQLQMELEKKREDLKLEEKAKKVMELRCEEYQERIQKLIIMKRNHQAKR